MKGTLAKGILEERLDTEWTGSSGDETLVKRIYQTSPCIRETVLYLVTGGRGRGIWKELRWSLLVTRNSEKLNM